MSRLTQEREKKIRQEFHDTDGIYETVVIRELLAEIDALRAENEHLKENARIKFKNNVELRQRIDSLEKNR